MASQQKAKYFCSTIFVVILAVAFGLSFAAGDDSAKALVERADRIRFPAGGYQVIVKVTSSAPGKAQDVRTYEILSKGNDRTIVRTLAPVVDKGQVLLMRDKDLWIFMPAVSQPIRLSLSQRLTGQVANGDLARANFSGDYNPTIAKIDSVNGEPYVVLDLKAVDRSVTYHRVIYWIHKESNRPVKAEFYALSGKLLKTCHFENYKEVGGEVRPTTLVMEDAVVEGSKSLLDYSNLREKDLPDKIFSKDYLRRLQ